VLAALLTAPTIKDRVLGSSKAVPNTALILLTGNNLTLAGDLTRRILVGRIDPQTDQPHARRFGFDPLAVCLGARPRLIEAVLTLLRGWLTTGIGRLGQRRMASFERWVDLVRQCVIWAGRVLTDGYFGDPVTTTKPLFGCRRSSP
jgi:hypothetical protein